MPRQLRVSRAGNRAFLHQWAIHGSLSGKTGEQALLHARHSAEPNLRRRRTGVPSRQLIPLVQIASITVDRQLRESLLATTTAAAGAASLEASKRICTCDDQACQGKNQQNDNGGDSAWRDRDATSAVELETGGIVLRHDGVVCCAGSSRSHGVR